MITTEWRCLEKNATYPAKTMKRSSNKYRPKEIQKNKTYDRTKTLAYICGSECISGELNILLTDTNMLSSPAADMHSVEPVQIKLVKILQELIESEPKAYPKHQRERWTNTSSQTIKLQVTSRVSSSFPNRWQQLPLLN